MIHTYNWLAAQEWAKAHGVEQRVCGVLQAAGLYPETKKFTLVDHPRFDEFDGTCDIYIRGMGIEVKGRNNVFDSDGSYKYKTIFIDGVRGYDLKKPRPVAVIIVCQKTYHMIAVPTKADHLWSKVPNKDRRGASEQHLVYEAPSDQCRPMDSLIDFFYGKNELF